MLNNYQHIVKLNSISEEKNLRKHKVFCRTNMLSITVTDGTILIIFHFKTSFVNFTYKGKKISSPKMTKLTEIHFFLSAFLLVVYKVMYFAISLLVYFEYLFYYFC